MSKHTCDLCKDTATHRRVMINRMAAERGQRVAYLVCRYHASMHWLNYQTSPLDPTQELRLLPATPSAAKKVH